MNGMENIQSQKILITKYTKYNYIPIAFCAVINTQIVSDFEDA